jgi:uncharacterized protein (DUF1330 family)
MTSSYWSLAVALLVGVAIGAATVGVLNAQSSPPAYYVAENFEVTDPDAYKSYVERVPAIVAKFGGRYLARGGKTESLQGEPPKTIIIITFKSMADARKWWDSPEYGEIKSIRQRVVKSRNFMVEGVPQ